MNATGPHIGGPVVWVLSVGVQRFLHFCEIGTVLVSPFAK